MAQIKVKLNEVANSLGKSILDISRDTGLNRNTITSLYHNKVDGIKFDTLRKLCEKYNLQITDLIDFDRPVAEMVGYVKDTRPITPFLVWFWMVVNDSLPKEYFSVSMGPHSTFYQKEMGTFYNNHYTLVAAGKVIFKDYSAPSRLNFLTQKINERIRDLEVIYSDADEKKISSFSNQEFIEYYNKIALAYKKFAELTTFIHAFDSGYDRELIQRLSAANKLKPQEVAALTRQNSYNFYQEKQLRTLDLVKKLRVKKITSKEFSKRYSTLTKTDASFIKFLQDFDYQRLNLAGIFTMEENQLYDLIVYYLNNEKVALALDARLKKQNAAADKQTEKILKRHKLKDNPLWFFKRLSELREIRKRANLMGIYVLDLVLKGLEYRTKIPLEYLR